MSTQEPSMSSNDTLLHLTVDIVTAYVANNPIPAKGLAELINEVYGTLARVTPAATATEETNLKPAVPIKKSIHDDYIVCLEDGKKLKMLKRYLRTRFDLSPEEYRARWNLPPDYPMVAPSYAAKRSDFAKKIGLGKSNAKSK